MHRDLTKHKIFRIIVVFISIRIETKNNAGFSVTVELS